MQMHSCYDLEYIILPLKLKSVMKNKGLIRFKNIIHILKLELIKIYYTLKNIKILTTTNTGNVNSRTEGSYSTELQNRERKQPIH